MKDDKLHLLHISECLDRIDRYVSEGAGSIHEGYQDARCSPEKPSGHDKINPATFFRA